VENPGVFTLAALQIAAAKQQALLSPILDLDGMSAVTLEANFQFGSGSGTCSAIVATSFDGGITWRHVARFDFGVASRTAIANLAALSSKAIANYADLNAEGVNDGMLGDRLAVLLTSTGAYLGTTLSLRAAVR
jgi:hypothetical protein